MKKFTPYLLVFALGLLVGAGNQDSPTTETRTVFIDKPVTREVVKTKVVREVEPMPASCEDVASVVGNLVAPAETLAGSAGEIKQYANDLAVQAYHDSVPAINQITVKLRLAKDEQGSAGIELAKAIEHVNNQFLQCQQDLSEGSD